MLNNLNTASVTDTNNMDVDEFENYVWKRLHDLSAEVTNYIANRSDLDPFVKARFEIAEEIMFAARRATYLNKKYIIRHVKRLEEFINERFSEAEEAARPKSLKGDGAVVNDYERLVTQAKQMAGSFRVGDEVRLVYSSQSTDKYGLLTTITYKVESVSHDGLCITLEGENGTWLISRFEKVEEVEAEERVIFEKGERVVAIEDDPSNDISNGEVFVVDKFDPDDVDNDYRFDGVWLRSLKDGHQTFVFTKRVKKLPEDYRARAGDTLRCINADINADSSCGGALMEGELYVMRNEDPYWQHGIYLNDLNGNLVPPSWRRDRFEVVQVADPSRI